MEVTGVTTEDVAQAQALQNVLRNAEIKIPVTESHAVSKTLTWFKDLCIALGRGYAKAAPAAVTPASPPPPSEGGGLKIKEYNPGTPPKEPRRKQKAEAPTE